MKAGTYISGAGHLGLIGWVLFGGLFLPTEAAQVPQDISVSILSSDEFAALSAPQPSEVTQPAPPVPPTEADSPDAPQPDTPVEVTPPPTPEAPPVPDVAPQIDPLPQAEVTQTAPAAPPSPDTETAATVVLQTPDPKPRPAPRVAPVPAALPDPNTEVDDVLREEVVAAPDPKPTPTPREEAPATAPEEAAPEIVTEAETPSAPVKSIRPKTRPSRPTRVAQPETPAAPARDTQAEAIAAAVAAAAGAVERPNVPQGPPLTGGEKDALRVAVQRCWNTGSMSSDALNTTVVVAVSMAENGKPEVATIRMLSFTGGSKAAASQAFEAARRAIIRCGARGYDLPVEKYSQWQDIEMTFNPERMRIK